MVARDLRFLSRVELRALTSAKRYKVRDVQAFPRYPRRVFLRRENLFARHSLLLRRTRVLMPLPVPFLSSPLSFIELYKMRSIAGYLRLHSLSCIFSIGLAQRMSNKGYISGRLRIFVPRRINPTDLRQTIICQW